MDDLLPTPDIRLTELHSDNISEALKINPEIIVIGFVTFELSLLHKRLAVVRKTESLAEIVRRVATAEIEIRKILQQRSLYTSVIEVAEVNEHLILDEVLATLTPYLQKGG